MSDRIRPRPLGGPFTTSADRVFTVAIAPDGATLAIARDGETTLFDITALHDFHTDPLAAACSRDGGAIPRTLWDLYAQGIPWRDPCER